MMTSSSFTEHSHSSAGNMFTEAQKLWKCVDTYEYAASQDLDYQDLIQRTLKAFVACVDLTRRRALFSSNELAQDINTADLRFVLADAYIGDLFIRLVTPNRRALLTTAKNHLDAFMHICEAQEWTTREDQAYFEEEILGSGIKDAAVRRRLKIARFKREKEIKLKLENLHELLSTSNHTGSDCDDDVDRDVVMTMIELFIQRSLEHLLSIKQELEMIELSKDQAPKEASSSRESGQKLDVNLKTASGPLLSKDGRPLRPFIITDQRSQLREQVFRPGWRLPTMTIDEYLETEMERGNLLQGGGERPEKPIIDDKDYAALDAETIKAREWDDFKDANPKGWGNRCNKG